jgi:hypothetical protein
MKVMIDQPARYYCKEDESCFFQWLRSISAFLEARLVPEGLELSFNTPIDRESLYSLIGLLARYGVNPKPLRALCHPGIEEWFKDEAMYWHSAVFGD